jgi:hypothetical protein
MAQLPADNVKLIQHAGVQVAATYTKGETVHRLQALTTQYAACSCLLSIDGNFCKHQLLALQRLYLSDSQSVPEHQQQFRALCVRALGTDFERVGGCSADNISFLISILSQTFPPRTAITNIVSTSAAGELLRPSTPPHPSCSACAVPPKLTPGKAILTDAPCQKRARDDLYATLQDPNTDHDLRRQLRPQLQHVLAQAQLIEQCKVRESANPLCLIETPFNVPDEPQTVKHNRSAAEASRSKEKAVPATPREVTI